MDRRLGRIAGIAAIGLALVRMGRLVLGGEGLPQWPALFVAAALLGGVLFWLLVLVFPRRPVLAATLFGLGAILLLLRVAVPHTLVWGVLPTLETLAPLALEVSEAMRLIRYGVGPVLPTPGLLAVISVVMWSIGGLFAWGATNGPISAIFLPPIVLYLQLAVSDRLPAGLTWTLAVVAILGMGLTALALQRRALVGRVRDSDGRALARQSPYLALAVAGLVALSALVLTESASGLVPNHGALPWRSGGSGYGLGGSGFSPNRLVDLKQRIISRTNQVLFRATLGEESPPGDLIYWRMETLDTFDGTAWRRGDFAGEPYDPDRGVPAADDLYRGTSNRILHQVQIDNLRGEGVLPTAGVPLQVHDVITGGASVPTSTLLVLDDSALLAPSGLQRGATYQLVASHSDIDADLGALATDEDGALSPLFAAAAEEGVFDHSPRQVAVETTASPDLLRFTDLPDDVPATITRLAFLQTRGATTDFEKAWLLQHWFRDSGEFTYSTEVSTGHTSLDLEDWLTEPTSQNHRIGYCEQFAASMAVLGRALGIPSRVVWGFTPGRIEPQENGADIVVVRDTNAHAWVEMWMDGFGWVAFDPTPRGEFQPASPTAAFDPAEFVAANSDLGTLSAPDPNVAPDGLIEFEDVPPVGGARPTPRWWLLAPLVVAGLLTVIPAAKSLRRRRRMERLRTGDITAAWDEIVDRLIDLGDPVPAAKTPMEVARETDNALVSLAVAYSSTIYGGRTGLGKESDLIDLEGWFVTRYDGRRRLLAALSPRSLLGREG